MEVSVCIAGHRLGIRLADESLWRVAEPAWKAFQIDGEPSAWLDVEVRPGPLEAGTTNRTMPRVEPVAEGGLRLLGDCFEGWISPDRARIRLVQQRERFPIDAVIKVWLAERLRSEGGLLLHGCGVARGTRAAVFVGDSGAGKSTLGALCRAGGLEVLSDELVAVRPERGAALAHGTPWNVGAPCSARLELLGTLAFGPAARVDEASGADVLRVLLPNALMVEDSAEGRAWMFRAASGLIGDVRSVRLTFARAPDVADALRRALEER